MQIKVRYSGTSPFPEDWPAHRPDYCCGGTVGLYDSSLWTGVGAWAGWACEPSLSWVLWRRWTWPIRCWVRTRPFRCHVCGVQCATAPADSGFWTSTAVCPAHCEDHDFQHDRDLGYPACGMCGEPAPPDWGDCD